jgi:selenocysteine lyase/cysteine desulfurase
MIPCQRSQFDIPNDTAYLNCAYMSPLLNSVVQAGEEAVRGKSQPWHTSSEDFFTQPEQARTLFGRLIGGDADGIAIVPSASYGIAAAANNLSLEKGQEILVLAEQFPSNIYSWQRLASENGGSINTVSAPTQTSAGEDWTPAILDAMSERTSIVALPHCHWTDGALIDLIAVSHKAKEVGAALVLDLSQSLGAMPFDVAQIDPDFIVAPTYKWLMGPYAMGFLYVAPRWRDGRPLEENWILRKGSENFAGLVDYQDDYQAGARRFDMGERANFQLMPMAVKALEQILDWGVDNISTTLQDKTDAIATRVNALGLKTGSADLRAPHFLGVRFPDQMPEGLLQKLANEKVYVSVRGSSMRITPHLYNTDQDIDYLFAALETII